MFWWLAQNLLMAAVLAGAVVLLCRLGRFRPAVRHALWLVVLVKLLTPPGVQWPWPLPDPGPALWPRSATAEEPFTSFQSVLPPGDVQELLLLAEEAIPAQEEILALVAEGSGSEAFVPQASPEKGVSTWPARVVALGLVLWLAGGAGMVILQAIRIVRFGRLLVRGRAAPPWLVRQLRELAARLGMRPPVLRVVPDLGTPLLWSLGRPQLLWPASLLEELPAHCRRSVLAHELAHLGRRDHWVGWLLLLAECVWWWNPLFWYVRRQLRENAELACDAWVVAVLPEDRRAYAEALIEVSQLVATVAAPVPAVGMSRGPRQIFERRLTMIMRERVPCRVPVGAYLAIGLLTLIALPAWSLGQQADEPKPESAPVRYGGPAPDGVIELVMQPVVVAQPAAGTERDRKLQDLEKKLEALLNEVKALRSARPAVPPPAPKVHYELVRPKVHAEPTLVLPSYRATMSLAFPGATGLLLSRTTYKLPRTKAEALAAFLREHVKASVMETKVEGESLVITTTPEAQKAIGQLIGLIQGGSSEKPQSLKLFEAPVGDKLFFRLHEEDTKRDRIKKYEKAAEEKPEVFFFKYPEKPETKSDQSRP